MVCLSRPYQFKFFKGCLPQISLGPFLNTLSHLWLRVSKWLKSEAHSEPYPTSNMELYVKLVNSFSLSTIFAKYSILDVWQGS